MGIRIRGKPDSQDLADLLIEQLDEGDVKDTFYRLTEKLKEIFDFYDNGDLVGPQGARGPQGPPGPPGATVGIPGPPGEDGSADLIKTFICDASVPVNAPVLVGGPGFVQVSSDNNSASPIIGIVIERPTIDTCRVQVLGFYNLSFPQGDLYLSVAGTLSTVRPLDGFVQVIGYSYGDGSILIQPQQQRVFIRNL